MVVAARPFVVGLGLATVVPVGLRLVVSPVEVSRLPLISDPLTDVERLSMEVVGLVYVAASTPSTIGLKIVTT